MNIGLYKIRDKDFLSEFHTEDVDNLQPNRTYNSEILIWNNNFQFVSEALQLFPELKLFINWGHEDANIKVNDKEFSEKNIQVAKVDSWAIESVSEYILMQLINFNRTASNPPEQLYRKKVGFVGFGKIAFRLASVLHNAFHCDVQYNATHDHSLPGFTYSSIENLVSQSDYLIILAKSRECQISSTLLHSSKKELVIVNFSRDEILPFKEIIPHLNSRHIRGFIGDVVPQEAYEKIPQQALLLTKVASRTREAKTLKEATALFFLKRHLLKKEGRPFELYLVRHGQSEANELQNFESDTNLTEIGIQQAKAIAKYLKNKPIQIVFTSPLKRAHQTAEIVAKEIGAPLQVRTQLAELNFGIFSGKPRALIENLFPDFFISRKRNAYAKLFIPYPLGESYYETYLRMLPTLMEALKQGNSLAIVGHESLNRMIRSVFNTNSLTEMLGRRQKNNQLIHINILTGTEDVIEIP